MDFKSLINVYTIEAGSVMGATSQKYKLFICCSTLEAKGCWLLNYQNLRFSAHVMYFQTWLYKNAYRNEAGGVVGAILHESIKLLCIIKHKNVMHAHVALQKL